MTTATTAADLLPAICDPENFGDDGLRLAYSDALEEQGELDRAEVIRLQVRGMAWPHRPLAGVAREVLGKTLAGLVLADVKRGCGTGGLVISGKRGPRWNITSTRRGEYYERPEGGPDYARPVPRVRVRVGRGFVYEVWLPCADWLAHGPALVRRQPVEVVRLTDKGPTEYVHGGDVSYWRWFNGSRGSGRRYEDAPVDMTCDELPGRLWKVYSRLVTAHGMTWEHPSEAEAIDALSAAALAWARATGPTP